MAAIVAQGLKARPRGIEIGIALGVAVVYLLVFVRMGLIFKPIDSPSPLQLGKQGSATCTPGRPEREPENRPEPKPKG